MTAVEVPPRATQDFAEDLLVRVKPASGLWHRSCLENEVVPYERPIAERASLGPTANHSPYPSLSLFISRTHARTHPSSIPVQHMYAFSAAKVPVGAVESSDV